ncbi:hypothetical protein GCM10007385_30550 [Tateyamaria omphalii]|uniref:DUF4864 domain-containing protein n=1 Tax=Tateyamaria omphalii TaxID=299262 RepID=UPI00167A9A21|nr:DUF4864 domain-containing protein [Tateyamaria omphalii]GGX59338.1 hypothetical protein GCM10007385_30550 [Tateyamaria omphalii]
MRKWMIGAVFACSLAGAAFAQGAEIEGVIASQIEAFKADDFTLAFTFAAPSIRGIFRTPENFGRMVTQGYPMVWRPADVTYLDLREEAGTYVQTVRIEDTDGVTHFLAYSMVETGDGWKISGVQLLDAPGVSA